MSDKRSQGLMHVVLTPTQGKQGESALEVCRIEPVAPERLDELLALFAQASAADPATMQGAAEGPCPCPLCAAMSRGPVSEAVRRALWDG